MSVGVVPGTTSVREQQEDQDGCWFGGRALYIDGETI